MKHDKKEVGQTGCCQRNPTDTKIQRWYFADDNAMEILLSFYLMQIGSVKKYNSRTHITNMD